MTEFYIEFIKEGSESGGFEGFSLIGESVTASVIDEKGYREVNF